MCIDTQKHNTFTSNPNQHPTQIATTSIKGRDTNLYELQVLKEQKPKTYGNCYGWDV